MSALDKLSFVRSAPDSAEGSKGQSPVAKARKRLVADIDLQIALANDPDFVETKTVRKRAGGTVEKTRKPRSWIVSTSGGNSYINIRYSNKVLSVGGKRGSIIECPSADVAATLEVVREWALSGDADGILEKAIAGAKRQRRKA